MHPGTGHTLGQSPSRVRPSLVFGGWWVKQKLSNLNTYLGMVSACPFFVLGSRGASHRVWEEVGSDPDQGQEV